jgi:dienelactone hydrolase
MTDQTIEYVSAGRGFAGFFFEPAADAAAALPAVMVLHGGAGIGEHERERARRLADLGYIAFAPDLFGEAFASRERGIAVITALVADPHALRTRLGDALAAVRAHPRVDGARVAAIGFCFGGLAALELARSGADVRAVVSFHGGLTTRAPAEAGAVKAKVTVCTGADDPFAPREQRVAFEDEMTRAGADWQMCVYGRAVHGFTERTPEGKPPRPGCAYDEAADRRSWAVAREVLA